jgi:hypothetical protein
LITVKAAHVVWLKGLGVHRFLLVGACPSGQAVRCSPRLWLRAAAAILHAIGLDIPRKPGHCSTVNRANIPGQTLPVALINAKVIEDQQENLSIKKAQTKSGLYKKCILNTNWLY